MTAPSAPGVALYAGAWGVTRGPDGKGGEVVGPISPTTHSALMAYWPWQAPNKETYTRDGLSQPNEQPWAFDIIHVEPTREAAEAWLRAYLDAQDRAANPERRRAVAEVPEGGWGAEVLPAKPFSPIDWTPTPPPEAAPTPAPDWPWASVTIDAVDEGGERTIEVSQADASVVLDCGEGLFLSPENARALAEALTRYALIAAMQEKKP